MLCIQGGNFYRIKFENFTDRLRFMKFPCELFESQPTNTIHCHQQHHYISSIATANGAECSATFSSCPPSALIILSLYIIPAFSRGMAYFSAADCKMFPKIYFEQLAKLYAIQQWVNGTSESERLWWVAFSIPSSLIVCPECSFMTVWVMSNPSCTGDEATRRSSLTCPLTRASSSRKKFHPQSYPVCPVVTVCSEGNIVVVVFLHGLTISNNQCIDSAICIVYTSPA